MIYGCIQIRCHPESISISNFMQFCCLVCQRIHVHLEFVLSLPLEFFVWRCFLVVFVVLVQTCNVECARKGKKMRLGELMRLMNCRQWYWAILTNTVWIHGVEEDHANWHDLKEWCDTSAFGLTVFVIPTPICPTDGADHCSWCLITTSQPCSQFTKFHLCQWSIGCSSHSWQIKEMIIY